jgi:hypothetical protein
MKTSKIVLSTLQRAILEKISKEKTVSSRDKERSFIILGLSSGVSSLKLSNQLKLNRHTVRRCHLHWNSHESSLLAIEAKSISAKKPSLLRQSVLSVLSDAPRSGCPSKFSAEQYCQILAVALEKPSDSGHEVTHWSLNILKQEIEKRKIVDSISRAQLGAFLKRRWM